MADIFELQGSFGSLLDTLRQRLDPSRPADVFARYQATMTGAAAIGRATAAWNAMPEESADYAALVHQTDGATRELVIASTQQSDRLLSALNTVDAAIGGISQLLGLMR